MNAPESLCEFPDPPTEDEVAEAIIDLLESDDPVVQEFLWGGA